MNIYVCGQQSAMNKIIEREGRITVRCNILFLSRNHRCRTAPYKIINAYRCKICDILEKACGSVIMVMQAGDCGDRLCVSVWRLCKHHKYSRF